VYSCRQTTLFTNQLSISKREASLGQTIGLILTSIFSFYFAAIDAFFGRPDSLEAMIVFAIFAIILMAITVAVPLTALLGVALYHFGPALVETTWQIERAVKAIRSIAPLWAWVAIGTMMYFVGMPFGDVAAPHYATLVGSIYSVTFMAMMLAGIWAAKQKQGENTMHGYMCACFAAGALVGCLSVPFFSWAVAPGIGILTAFCGLLGMTIQIIIESRRQQPCRCRY